MWRVRCVAAAALASANLVICADAARAEGEPLVIGEYNPNLLFFSGVDLWRHGAFAHGGVLWSPGGLAHEGFTLKLLLAGGLYRYEAGTTEIMGRHLLAALLPGWRFRLGRHQTVIHLGPEVQDHRLLPDDLNNRLRGTRYGVRGSFDFWFQPTDLLMLSGAFSASTIEWNFWSRMQAGV
jgi:hypothetical protein